MLVKTSGVVPRTPGLLKTSGAPRASGVLRASGFSPAGGRVPGMNGPIFRGPRALASLPSVRLQSTVPLSFDKWEARQSDPQQPPIVILHGLFGSKLNNRTVARALARDLKTTVYCPDLRNHGDSPHAKPHNYATLSGDVIDFINRQRLPVPPTVIGHSMGAKTAMAVALRAPELVSNLIPVDNGPLSLQLSPEFGHYVEGMIAVDRAGVHQQSEMYDIIKPYVPTLPVQQFLLSNFKRDPQSGAYRCRLALDILAKSLGDVSDFDEFASSDLRFTGPTLLIRGSKSNFVPDESLPLMGQLFPKFEVRDVDAGHWLISEKPHDFLHEVKAFLNRDD